MCDSAGISNKIVRLGTASFRNRLEVAGGMNYNVSKLSRLNRALKSFYRILYAQFNSVTKEDYEIFGPQLKVLLKSIKELHTACEKMPKTYGLSEETKKLGMNYSAIYEINSDIVNFRIKALEDPELSQLMTATSSALKQLAQ